VDVGGEAGGVVVRRGVVVERGRVSALSAAAAAGRC
jgi:hypothetical protein